MDTTLRSKAMEKESLTSKFLFNGCNLSLILVQYMLVSVQCMSEAFSQPTLFHFIFHFHDISFFTSMIPSRMFLEGEEVEFFQGHWFKYVTQIESFNLCKVNFSFNLIK